MENFRWYHWPCHYWLWWQEPPTTHRPRNARGLHQLSLAVLVHFSLFFHQFFWLCSIENLEGKSTRILSKAEKLILVSDTVFHYGVSNCTEIRAQIKIDQEKGTTVSGSLRYEELLPADSLMYVILFYGQTRNVESSIQAETLISYMKDEVIKSYIQIGGNETLGCGLFQIEWIKGGKND